MSSFVSQRGQGLAGCVAALLLIWATPSLACVGKACLQIWSTADGGGALTIEWHFDDPAIHAVGGFCAGGQCLFSTIDPGFITSSDPPSPGFFALADGTEVSVEIVADAPEAALKIEGAVLAAAGDSTTLGTAPTLHEHPSWQLKLSDGVVGDYTMSFKLTTTSALYAESETYVVTLSNRPTPTPLAETPTATPTTTPTATALRCIGDCNGDGQVTIDEVLHAVNMSLGTIGGADVCLASFDANGDGVVAINELISAVNDALDGCPSAPTPTPTIAARLANIQVDIFTPRCAIPTCHDSQYASGNLVLDAQHAYGQLVGIAPDVDAAAAAGMLRVDPGHPENSFLISKLEGPPLGQGSRMPLTGDPLTADQVQLIADWIAAGAQP